MTKALVQRIAAIDRNHWLLLALAVISLFVIYVWRDIPVYSDDTISYIDAIRAIKGESVTQHVFISRILTTPLLLGGAMLFNTIFNNYYFSIFSVNLVLYLFFPAVMYKLALAVLEDRKSALIAAILAMSNYYYLFYGPSGMADMGGWFFYVWSTYFGVKHYRSLQLKHFLIAMVLSSVGLLFKEYGILGAVNAFLLALFSGLKGAAKNKRLVLGSLAFLVLPLVHHLSVYFIYGFTYFDWYAYAEDKEGWPGRMYTVTEFVKVVGWLFFAGWPAFLYSLQKFYRNYDRQLMKLMAILLPASLAFMAWPVFLQRLAFVFMPLLSIFTAYGLSRAKYKVLVSAYLVLYLIVNYHIGYLIKVINIS